MLHSLNFMMRDVAIVALAGATQSWPDATDLKARKGIVGDTYCIRTGRMRTLIAARFPLATKIQPVGAFPADYPLSYTLFSPQRANMSAAPAPSNVLTDPPGQLKNTE